MRSFKLEKIRPELFFVIFASFFGAIILFITPPFQIPDEINHFYKAYQVSEGNFISVKKDKRVGGYLPVSVVKITEPFLWLRWNSEQKTNSTDIFKTLSIPLRPEEKVFVDFPNTAMYSFISYAPQASAIFVLKAFSVPPLVLFYCARLFALLFWIVTVFYAIKIIPLYKWLFTLLALLPMSLFINMSLSADVVTNALAFLSIAVIFRLAYSQEKITKRDIRMVILLTFFLASAKMVYAPLALLFLIIPVEKFKNRNSFYGINAVVIGISVLTALLWSVILNSLYVPYSAYHEGFRDAATLIKDANMHDQLNYILQHGNYFFSVMCKSVLHTFDMYFNGYIGTFGWLDTPLPAWLITISYLVIIVTAMIHTNEKIRISFKNKLVMLFAFITSLIVLLLSQHLTWDVVGGDVIGTIQGRYLIPLLPLLFMLCYNYKFNYSKLVPPLVITFSFIALSITVYTLLIRYY